MKKYNSSNANIAAIIVTLFALAPVAHAAVISGGATTVVSNGGVMHSETKVSASASATPVTGVHMVGGVNTAGGIKMEDGGDIKAEGSMEQKDGHSGEVRGENEDELDVLNKSEFRIDLDNEVMKDEGKGDIDVAEDVHSEIDFKHFVAHKAKADAHIKSVNVGEGNVEVAYEESGKWFGFLSGTVIAHASADMKGDVNVSYPWYHIFMNGTHSSASLQSEIARAIAAERKGEKAGVSSTTVRADVSAAFGIPNLFEIIANTLKKVSASATADATATAAVK